MKTPLHVLYLCCILFAVSSCVQRKPEPIQPEPITASELCGPSYAGKMKIAVIIYNGVEVLDMNGPIDVFTKANYIRDHYYVYTVAAKDTMIFTENCNTAIKPRYTFANCPFPDIVVLPGAPMNTINELLADSNFNNKVLKWVKDYGADTNNKVMSVCTGGILLGKTGLLNGRTATTHYLALQDMQQLYPKVNVIGGVRFVEDANTITTAGITSGIDGALHLVEKYDGKEMADSAAHIMVYNRDCPMR